MPEVEVGGARAHAKQNEENESKTPGQPLETPLEGRLCSKCHELRGRCFPKRFLVGARSSGQRDSMLLALNFDSSAEEP